MKDFSPGRLNDPFRWIPQGVYYDMIDDRNDFAVSGPPLPIDNVSNYTNQQLFQALGPNVKSMPQFRAVLLQENNNAQAAEVNLLFNRYNY